MCCTSCVLVLSAWTHCFHPLLARSRTTTSLSVLSLFVFLSLLVCLSHSPCFYHPFTLHYSMNCLNDPQLFTPFSSKKHHLFPRFSGNDFCPSFSSYNPNPPCQQEYFPTPQSTRPAQNSLHSSSTAENDLFFCFTIQLLFYRSQHLKTDLEQIAINRSNKLPPTKVLDFTFQPECPTMLFMVFANKLKTTIFREIMIA